jgi:hypothetical protein
MSGDQLISPQIFEPATASSWSVAALADFNGDGCSDLLLRDTNGNLEVIYFYPAAPPTTTDFKVAALGYSATASYAAAYGNSSGHFDTSWNIAASGIFQTLGTAYASLIWVNPSSGQVGITRFTPFLGNPLASQVFAMLPADTVIQAVADFDGDGGKDLLLWNAGAAQSTIWFMNFDNGAFYQAGPVLQPGLPAGLQLVPN